MHASCFYLFSSMANEGSACTCGVDKIWHDQSAQLCLFSPTGLEFGPATHDDNTEN